MLKLKQEGKIRAIGLSRFSLRQLEEIIQYVDIDILQYEYNLLERSVYFDILPFCIKNNIGFMAYSPIARGILTGRFHFDGYKLDPDDNRNKDAFFSESGLESAKELIWLLKDLSEKYDCRISQLSLSWLLAQEGVTTVITGTQKEKHIAENARAVDIAIEQEDMEKIDQVSMEVYKKIGPTSAYEMLGPGQDL